MTENQRRTADNASRTMRIQSTWQPGPRTASWDALWARILSDVAPQLLTEQLPAHQEPQGDE